MSRHANGARRSWGRTAGIAAGVLMLVSLAEQSGETYARQHAAPAPAAATPAGDPYAVCLRDALRDRFDPMLCEPIYADTADNSGERG